MAPVTEGFWSEPTSLVDWCEKNYEVNYYVAEFWNTLSNLGLILPPLYGIIFAIKDGLELRFITSHGMLICVGVGSWLFHMTLQWWSQLLDEMPMIWGTSALIYTAWQTHSLPRKHNYMLVVGLLFYCSFVTWLYVSSKEYVYFEWAYGSMAALYMALSVAYLRKSSSIRLYVFSLSIYISGLILWNYENKMCPTVTMFRENLIYPFRPFTQLHAWWHVFAGMGTYLGILANCDARLKFLKQTPSMETFLLLPVIRLKSKAT